MIVNMLERATGEEVNQVIKGIENCNYQAHVNREAGSVIIGAVGRDGQREALEALRSAPGVAEIVPVSHPFTLASREIKHSRTIVEVGG
ncbi:MAG: 3-deoxy-7-phosphoheptulonate synthase, partial [Acidobacteria bacterium]|nr:3-deoxy-7-phosphoheptulonate synthase [Acidobacteriota bacterium]